MNPISTALTELKFRIPYEILKEAFKDDFYSYRKAPVSLDDQILNKVIRPRVIAITNIVGGQTVIVPINSLVPSYTDGYIAIYEIPAEYLNYRSINSVQSIGHAYQGDPSMLNSINNNSLTGGADVLLAAQRVANAMSSIPNVSNASVELIGYNTILIRNCNNYANNYQLRCTVGFEEQLNNLSPRFNLVFSKACELAVKSFIYNKLIIKIDQAFLTGGQELGMFKNYIDNLSESEEMFLDYVKNVYQSVLYMHDEPAYTRFIALQLCPGV